MPQFLWFIYFSDSLNKTVSASGAMA
jgi:hypothetical protein